MKKSAYMLSLLFIAFPQLLSAQVFRDRLEKRNTHHEIRIAKKHLERDPLEIGEFKNSIKDFKIAYLSGDEDGLNMAKSNLVVQMDREIDQSRSKAHDGSQELRRSNRELQGAHQDLDQSHADLAFGLGKRWDARRDLRDDRRDRRDELRDVEDDRQDLAVLEKRLLMQEKIRDRFVNQTMITATRDINNVPEVVMLGNFLQTMEEDLLWTEEELKEDKKELREDRQELREDRRERREIRKEKKIVRQYHRLNRDQL